MILVIRADHLPSLVEDMALGAMARQCLHFVTPLAGAELKVAIEGPADLAGLRLEHGLVELVLRDAEGEPGALPLLSYALMETWRRRDGNVLTVEGYRESGGIRGAVARSADRLYDSLPSEQRTVLRSLMLRLVAPSIEGDPVRCRVSRTTLRGDAGRERIVDLLVRARLLTAEEGTVEIAHESLARAWPRLRTWLEDDTEGQRILRHLAASAAGWDSLGRPDSELYRGARLDTAVEYRAAARPDLTSVETAFIDASLRQRDDERAMLEERARRDARTKRSLRSLLVATALLLVLAIVGGLIAVRNAGEAGTQRDAARAPNSTPSSKRSSPARWGCAARTATSPPSSRSKRRDGGRATPGLPRHCSGSSPTPMDSSGITTSTAPRRCAAISSRARSGRWWRPTTDASASSTWRPASSTTGSAALGWSTPRWSRCG